MGGRGLLRRLKRVSIEGPKAIERTSIDFEHCWGVGSSSAAHAMASTRLAWKLVELVRQQMERLAMTESGFEKWLALGVPQGARHDFAVEVGNGLKNVVDLFFRNLSERYELRAYAVSIEWLGIFVHDPHPMHGALQAFEQHGKTLRRPAPAPVLGDLASVL